MTDKPFDLRSAAYAEMVQQGFHPELPPGSEQEVAEIRSALQAESAASARDLRGLPWSSIDNDSSRDLDQVEEAQQEPGGIRVRVGIADVAGAIAKGSALDVYAAEQAQTVYTAVRNFPMLPVELSTDLTSLNEGQTRPAVVVEFVVEDGGTISGSAIYEAEICNGAQLAYSKVGPWLEGKQAAPAKVSDSQTLQEQLKLQDAAARRLHAKRVADGALEFHRAEADPLVVDGEIKGIATEQESLATSLIEELMIAVNETMASSLREAKRSCIRRVVRSPERWPRIVELAKMHGGTLPEKADAAALNGFLREQMQKDPMRYQDLSVAVIKLIGPGEYVVSNGSGSEEICHFGLAARDYTHSTAPNRRFVDLVTQRLVKAMSVNAQAPYTDDELKVIAAHCNERETAARKVERAMRKREAAVALQHNVGAKFTGVITGVSDKGVYVRILQPPVEGRIVEGERGLDVGDKVEVTLLRTDQQRAFIDFKRG